MTRKLTTFCISKRMPFLFDPTNGQYCSDESREGAIGAPAVSYNWKTVLAEVKCIDCLAG